MITNITMPEMNWEEREEYKLRLRLINKIVCSYSRYDAFMKALSETSKADKYTVIAERYVAHDTVYILDEEGFMTTYLIADEVEFLI